MTWATVNRDKAGVNGGLLSEVYCPNCGWKFWPKSTQHRFCSDQCKEAFAGEKRNEAELILTHSVHARLVQAVAASGWTVNDIAARLQIASGPLKKLLAGPCVLKGFNYVLLCRLAEVIGCCSVWLTGGTVSDRAERYRNLLRAAARGDVESAKELFRCLEVLP